MTADRIAALRAVLEHAPDSHALRLLLADLLRDEGDLGAALAEYATLLRADALPAASLIAVGNLALQQSNAALVHACLHAARRAGVVEGVAALQSRLDQQLEQQGVVRLTLGGDAAPPPPQQRVVETTTFDQIGGLDAVKKVIHRLIILPLQRPELYRTYKRQAGGGVLLYGPPGCGKTMLARATSGECGLPFVNIRIEEILDPYFGVSERNLHHAFASARAQAPCVVFLDELDGLAFARQRQHSQLGRTLVDQLLQELDAIGAENSGLLILAATNAPWDVDDALLRPGRFDRRVFVPPPDETARLQILQLALAEVPTERLDLRRFVRQVALFSGADLRALVERALDAVIEEALARGDAPPLTMRHLEQARTELKPTTLAWLGRARNYVEFANHDDRYAEVAAFLRGPELRGVKL